MPIPPCFPLTPDAYVSLGWWRCTSPLLRMQPHRPWYLTSPRRGLRYRPTFEHLFRERGVSSQLRAPAPQSVSRLTPLPARAYPSLIVLVSWYSQDTRACLAMREEAPAREIVVEENHTSPDDACPLGTVELGKNQKRNVHHTSALLLSSAQGPLKGNLHLQLYNPYCHLPRLCGTRSAVL